MKEMPYVKVHADVKANARKKKLKNYEFEIEVVKWRMFPILFNAYASDVKGKSIFYKIYGFFILLKFYGNLLLSKN